MAIVSHKMQFSALHIYYYPKKTNLITQIQTKQVRIESIQWSRTRQPKVKALVFLFLPDLSQA